MTSVLLTVFEISVAMAIGFILGRIWQMRRDLEQQSDCSFTVPPIATFRALDGTVRLFRRSAAKLRIACDDGGSRKDKRAEHWVRPAWRHQSRDILSEAHMPFDFDFLLLCFFAMALLLERAPTRRNTGA